jgi:hypothetical protein
MLTTINFTGTIEKWKRIAKNYNWNFGLDKVKVVHCIDGDVEI